MNAYQTSHLTSTITSNQPYVQKKGCARCGRYKPISAFHVRRASPDGHQSYCAACNIARQYEPGGAAHKPPLRPF